MTMGPRASSAMGTVRCIRMGVRSPPSHHRRPFTSTPPSARNHKPPPPSNPQPDDDPFDLFPLSYTIQSALAKLKSDLATLRAGGRLNPSAIEALKVKFRGKGGKEAKEELVRLGDIAQVLPRGGRGLVVQVLDPDHLKPTMQALLGASLNLTPAPLPGQPTHLYLPIPAPTRELRLESAQRVQKAGEVAQNSIRGARAVVHKKLRGLVVGKEKGKGVRVDDVRRVEKGMEKVVEEGAGEARRLVEGARKAILEG
ncbi:hypothetical protein FGG08_004343 [Glutinoglossum americanum]|uniref:Ribosome recycling factor domain-containing protein n=1 Tax=Glutinoglossum americanum TaxID=1670608 RepID=A0A9P8I5X6_9PEZI|nr:hypothetical protein FGG08_004343 [Glutinoglossum americanum]